MRVTRLLLVTVRCTRLEVSEVRLVGEIDDELDDVSKVDYDEVGEADQ